MTHPPAARFAAGLIVAACLALTGGCSSPAAPHAPAHAGSRPSAPAGPATQGSAGAVAPEQWAAGRATAARQLLSGRLDAASRGDAAAWLARLDPSQRAAQTEIQRRMVAMGAGRFRLDQLVETVPPIPGSAGTAVDWDVELTASYWLTGFDDEPRSFSVTATLRADPAVPEAVLLTSWRPVDRPQPWDLDGLVVRRTPSALVLTTAGAARATEVERRAAVAARRVAAVLGRSEPAVWVAPRTDAEAAALLGREVSDLEGVAAATDGPIGVDEPAGADRIVIVPGPWTSLTGAGRDVVLTHELTHATVRRTSTRPVPVWLSEGFAEFVAYRAVDLPERRLVAPTVELVRRKGVPSSLPSAADLDPASGALTAAYGLSLLAVRELADRYGTAAVVRLYRGAAGAAAVPTSVVGDPEAVVDHLLQTQLHTDRAALVAHWRQRLSRLAG